MPSQGRVLGRTTLVSAQLFRVGNLDPEPYQALRVFSGGGRGPFRGGCGRKRGERTQAAIKQLPRAYRVCAEEIGLEEDFNCNVSRDLDWNSDPLHLDLGCSVCGNSFCTSCIQVKSRSCDSFEVEGLLKHYLIYKRPGSFLYTSLPPTHEEHHK